MVCKGKCSKTLRHVYWTQYRYVQNQRRLASPSNSCLLLTTIRWATKSCVVNLSRITSTLIAPNHSPHTVDKDSHEHFMASVPFTILAINTIEFSGLAQKQADLAQRRADAEKHVKLLCLPRDFGTTQMHRLDLHV